MKKILFLMLCFSLVAQAKILKRNYLGWSITCTIEHGQIVPNTPISIHSYSNTSVNVKGTYTEDGCIEEVMEREGNINKIKYRIHTAGGRFNPKNKQLPQVDVVAISLNDPVKIGGTYFSVTENDSTYTLASNKGIDFPVMRDEWGNQKWYFFTYHYYGKPKSMFLHVPKDSLVHMYKRFSINKEFIFEGKFPAVITYEKGHAESVLSINYLGAISIKDWKCTLNTGEVIIMDETNKNYYATTTDGIRLLPYWYKKFKKTQPYEGETLTHFYHRAYTADSLNNIKKEKEEVEKKNSTKKETDLIAQVEALGETPYQKAIKNIQTKYMKRFERECWVSSEVILGSALVSGIAGLQITNMAKFTVEMAPCLMEAVMKRPATAKSIMADMEKEMEASGMLNLRKPIEKELEELQLKQVNEKLKKK